MGFFMIINDLFKILIQIKKRVWYVFYSKIDNNGLLLKITDAMVLKIGILKY